MLIKCLDKYFEKNSRKSIMLAYGEIKETFLPRMCKARVEAKSNTKSACVEYQP